MWIDVKLRSPTEADGDYAGDVLWLHEDGSVSEGDWSSAPDMCCIGWMRIPEFRPLQEIPAGYRCLGREEYNQQQHPEAMFLASNESWQYITEAGRCYHPADTYIVPVEKKYRPFTDGEEFRPHRERWWRIKKLPSHIQPPQHYSATRYGQGARLWQTAFTELEFDDGSPFGVEVTE